MKKVIIYFLAITFSIVAMAQKFANVPDQLKNIPAKRPVYFAVDMPLDLSNGSSPFVAPHTGKAVNEVQVGTTRYDLQTNLSVQNRVYLFPDNTVGGIFTFGAVETSFPERGTGYNYYNLTSWGAIPSVRIESSRCGWPSYMPLPGGGELVISHNGITGLLISRRATKGTGTWTTTTLVGPTTSGGSTALLWPRAVARGNTIHLIACTDQGTSPTVYYYQGLALALVYYKSTDGGQTWTSPVILPGMDSASIVRLPDKTGFTGDSYSWAAPKGDTIAFVVGNSWGGLFAMKSFNAGNTWTKIHIYDFPALPTAPTPVVATVDGSVACAIDNTGKVHVLAGRMRVSDDSYTDSPPTSSYYPYTDGLIYWNENMAPLDSALLNDVTTMTANGQYIAQMIDYSGNGIIDFPVVGTGQFPFGNYYLSLTSMPQIIIEGNNIYITYSSVREDKDNPGANPCEQLYRHLYANRSTDLGTTWCTPIDLTGNALHDYDECVFGSLSYTTNANLHITYMADAEPGLAVRGDADAYTDNQIYYLTVPKTDLCAIVGKQEIPVINDINIYPNPATEAINIDLNLERTQNVLISIFDFLGQQVFANDYGTMNNGKQILKINTGNLNSGIYFVSVQVGGNKITRKIVVE